MESKLICETLEGHVAAVTGIVRSTVDPGFWQLSAVPELCYMLTLYTYCQATKHKCAQNNLNLPAGQVILCTFVLGCLTVGIQSQHTVRFRKQYRAYVRACDGSYDAFASPGW